jgi:hypothetical protein
MYNPKTSNWTKITTMPSNTIYEGCTLMPDDPFRVYKKQKTKLIDF